MSRPLTPADWLEALGGFALSMVALVAMKAITGWPADGSVWIGTAFGIAIGMLLERRRP